LLYIDLCPQNTRFLCIICSVLVPVAILMYSSVSLWHLQHKSEHRTHPTTEQQFTCPAMYAHSMQRPYRVVWPKWRGFGLAFKGFPILISAGTPTAQVDFLCPFFPHPSSSSCTIRKFDALRFGVQLCLNCSYKKKPSEIKWQTPDQS